MCSSSVRPASAKTHLAVALGLKARELGLRTMFMTAAGLITMLGKALYENRLEERLKLLTQPKLLIIDEIGYIPIDRQGANLFFQLISRRYERGSILLTSNQSLGAWGEVFGDTVIAIGLTIPRCATPPSNARPSFSPYDRASAGSSTQLGIHKTASALNRKSAAGGGGTERTVLARERKRTPNRELQIGRIVYREGFLRREVREIAQRKPDARVIQRNG
jgi:hypothetical protein